MYKGLLLQIVKDQLLLCYSFNSIAPGAIAVNYYFGLFDQNVGRSSKIRTCDPLHPMQVRYRAAPYSDVIGGPWESRTPDAAMPWQSYPI